jgi:transcriptional regulator with XRE-family HTH domain
MKPLGQKLKELRGARGLSLRGLSLELEGLSSAAHLSDIERGRRFPSKDLLLKLAQIFEVKFEELESYDARPGIKDLKRRADFDPAFGLKLQSFIESQGLTSEVPLDLSGIRGNSRRTELANTEIIIRLIASGLINLYQAHERTGEPPQASYSPKLQRGLDRLVALCLLKGKTPPQGVPDLLNLCERPFSEWPLQDIPEDIHPQDTLLCNRLPTFFCEDYARNDRDIEAALSEERFMHQVFLECAGHSPTIYTSLRQLLVMKPVLTASEFLRSYIRPPLNVIADLVKDAYEEAPAFMSHKGVYRCCPECGNLLMFSFDRGWLCRDESCTTEVVREGSAVREIPASSEDKVYRLKHPLRRYVAAPGRVELKLREKLLGLSSSDMRYKVELWPNVDAYDLRLTFPDNEIWAVDVKDWASPYSLAEKIKPFRTNPPWDRAFFVFPDRHKKSRRNYLEAFQTRCIYLSERIEALFESDLVAAARQKLRGHQ